MWKTLSGKEEAWPKKNEVKAHFLVLSRATRVISVSLIVCFSFLCQRVPGPLLSNTGSLFCTICRRCLFCTICLACVYLWSDTRIESIEGC